MIWALISPFMNSSLILMKICESINCIRLKITELVFFNLNSSRLIKSSNMKIFLGKWRLWKYKISEVRIRVCRILSLKYRGIVHYQVHLIVCLLILFRIEHPIHKEMKKCINLLMNKNLFLNLRLQPSKMNHHRHFLHLLNFLKLWLLLSS